MKKDILDKKDKILKIDPESMLSKIEEFPEQIKDCWSEIKDFIFPSHYFNAKNILVLGMGGSAIGGDLIKSLVRSKSKLSIEVLRDYDLPKYANNDTLVIVSSYSGNTEETLSAFAQAFESSCKILAITTGGQLQNYCQKHQIPCFKINYNSQPRAALGYSLISILGVLSKLDIYRINDDKINLALEDLSKLHNKINVDVLVGKNQAKELAVKLFDTCPLIIGSGILSPVARRYKTQINENSKQCANWDILPELNHNTIVGLDFPNKMNKWLFVLMLQSAYDNHRTKLRQQIMIKLFAKNKIKLELIMFAPSSSQLSEILKMILFGDYLSYYLAILNNVDPTPVDNIKYLKEKLVNN